jgi:S1-C subfamily serine protease
MGMSKHKSINKNKEFAMPVESTHVNASNLLTFRQRRPSPLPLTLSIVAVLLAGTSLVFQFFPHVLSSLQKPFSPVAEHASPSVPAPSQDTRQAINSPFSTVLADISESLAPSVVNIEVRMRPANVNADDELFRYFFGNQGFPFPQAPQEQGGQGSGVIYNAKKGYIITNNHVVQGATQMQVRLNNGKAYTAKLVGSDPLTDIAVIQLKSPEATLTAAKLGDSSHLRTGDWVLAMGSPLGFDHSVTLGIVSAMARRVPDLNEEVPFVQTDAAINPGNSGGALVDLYGEVIGINTAILRNGQNIGFAIPSNTVKQVADELIAHGQVKRAYVGVMLSALTPEIIEQLDLFPAVKGVVVGRVMPSSPASKAGLQLGDVIQDVQGVEVLTPKAFQALVRKEGIGKRLRLGVLRDKKRVTISLKTETMNPQAF